MAIGSSNEKGKIDLLVVQENSQNPMGYSGANFIAGQIESDESYEPFDNVLIASIVDSKVGLNAALLTYQRDEKGKYFVLDQDLEKLRKFAYEIILRK
jgi:hypothetical protein